MGKAVLRTATRHAPLYHDAAGRLDGSAIRHLDIFAELDHTLCDTIAQSSHAAHLLANESIFRQNDLPTRLFLILNGCLNVTHAAPNGSRIVVRTLGLGDFAGTASFFLDKPYPATATAMSDSLVLAWPRAVFLALMSKYPSLGLSVISKLAQFVVESETRLTETATERVERRIAHAILRLVRQAGRRIEGGIEISFPISRHDLAMMAGANLYTVSRTLSGWEQRGIIDGGRRRLVLRDPHALMRIAEEEQQGF